LNSCVISGPYMFGVSFATYLCSKEIYIMEHEYYNGLSLAILCIVIVKKLGPTIAAALDKDIDVRES
jgi:F-type H+-transporting ATPase subunit b